MQTQATPAVLRGVPPDLGRDGSGDGYGDGYGDGSGYGYGDGSGYGSGDGDGDGSGYGYGYWIAVLDANPVAKNARERGATVALYRSDRDGNPANHSGGTSLEPARVGLTQEVAGPLRLCSANALHATLNPEMWSGERLWIVALWGEVQEGEHKLGALKREFLAEFGGGQ